MMKKIFWECQESNPRLLGAKRERYPLCYAAPRVTNSLSLPHIRSLWPSLTQEIGSHLSKRSKSWRQTRDQRKKDQTISSVLTRMFVRLNNQISNFCYLNCIIGHSDLFFALKSEFSATMAGSYCCCYDELLQYRHWMFTLSICWHCVVAVK